MEEGTHDRSSSLSTGLELESQNVFMRMLLVRSNRGGEPILNVSDTILQIEYKKRAGRWHPLLCFLTADAVWPADSHACCHVFHATKNPRQTFP